MQEDMLWLVVAICAIVIAVSVAAMAWAIVRLGREAGRAAIEADGLMRVLREELPAALTSLQRTAASLEALAGESAARLVVVDRLAEEAEATMIALRDLSSSVNDIVRGPADTVTGVKRSAKMVGGGIASGADKLRRVITGEHDQP